MKIIVRDRGSAYAGGARAGALDARQIVDRFHLVENATDAFNELLEQWRWETATDGNVAPTDPAFEAEQAREGPVEAARPAEAASDKPPAASPESLPPACPPSPTKQQDIVRRAQGDSMRRIAETVHLHRRMVRRLLDSAEPPYHRRDKPRPGGITSPKLAPHTEYLQQRWREGYTNAMRLHDEIVERGYTDSRTLLSAAVRSWRPPRAPNLLRQKRNRRTLDPRRLWRPIRPSERLTDQERPVVQQLLDADEMVASASGRCSKSKMRRD